MGLGIVYPNKNTKQIDVILGELTLHFSYEILVAFNSAYSGIIICKNIWSSTTGRHLNEINPNKHIRVSYSEFESILREVLSFYNININI